MHLRRQTQPSRQLQWHNGTTIDTSSISLPTGVLLTSPWLDLTTSYPSWQHEPNYIDILESTQPPLLPDFPPDSIWPTQPPRGHPYCETICLDHPLVSPSAATDWHGAPPMLLTVGGAERARDGARTVAWRAQEQGVPVQYREYENMPHDFAVTLQNQVRAAHNCTRRMRGACRDFISGSEIKSDAKVYLLPLLEKQKLKWKELKPEGGWESHVSRMRRDAEEKTRQGPWKGPDKSRM